MDDYDLGARAYLFGYSNYLFKEEVVHLGKSKDENKKKFSEKFISYYEGIATMAFKNYNLKDLFLFSIVYLPYIFILNAALILYKKNIYLIFAPLLGLTAFFLKYKSLKEKRQENQTKRKVKNDIFLKISIPNFE